MSIGGFGTKAGPNAGLVAPLIGMLMLVASGLQAQPPSSDETWTYQVEKGDSLWTITDRHLLGLHWVAPLQQLNRVSDPHALPPGRELKIPLAWTRRSVAPVLVEAVSGQVGIQSGAEATVVPATAGQHLGSGDRLLTGADGYVLLRYPDRSSTRVFADSSVHIQAAEFLGDEARVRIRLDVDEGRSEHEVIPGSVTRGNDIQVTTPSATTSVRGTHFRVASDAAIGTSLISVLRGGVMVAGRSSMDAALGLSNGHGTVVRGDGAPLASLALLPAPNLQAQLGTMQRLPPVFQVPEVAGAAGYSGDLAFDPEHRSILASAVSSDAALAFSTDVPDGVYWLRVRALDERGLEGLDAGGRVVVHARPEPPYLMAPVSEAMVVAGKDLDFSWTRHPQAIGYELELAHLGQPGDEPRLIGQRLRVDDVSVQMPWRASMEQGSYVWRMRSLPAQGKPGPFGDWQVFRVVSPAPGVAAPTYSKREMTLAWPAGAGQADSTYRFQLARDGEFRSLLVDEVLRESRYTVERPRRGNYHVRVARINPQGEQEPWGSTQQLEVKGRSLAWLLGPAAVGLIFLL